MDGREEDRGVERGTAVADGRVFVVEAWRIGNEIQGARGRFQRLRDYLCMMRPEPKDRGGGDANCDRSDVLRSRR
jgi:hypothetical protein